jgi:hypothetical protein
MERPLSFAADMVRALQTGRKRQTRRPMYPQPDQIEADRFLRSDGREIVCPFGVRGDRLWVRERFAFTDDGRVVYATDPIKGRSRLEWQKSRYLARENSRLTLLVLCTRSQRLQEISEADARAEGYDAARESLSPIDWFARLWDRLSAVESLRWAANPWLWVVHFELIAQEEAQPKEKPALIASESKDEKPIAIKSTARTVRTATIEEKHQLARMLRSQSR